MSDLQSRIAALSPDQRARLESRVGDLVAARGSVPAERIAPRDRSRPTPLSYAQQREWALERYRPSNNIPAAIRLDGEIDLDLFGRCLMRVLERHEALRTTIEVVDRIPVQVVHPVTPIPLPVVDLSHLDEEEQKREIRRRYDAEVMLPFPLQEPQRIRITVLRLGPKSHVAVLTTHHSSSDGWSMNLIARDTMTLFQAMREGRDEVGLPPLPIQYGDFAVWQRQQLGEDWMAQELAYWREVLADIPPRLALPTDRPHPARRTFAGTCHTASLPQDLTEALKVFAEEHSVSTSMIMLAACSAMLYRYTDQDDLVFGSAISGRTRTEMEQVVGCFANALPLRMRLSRDDTMLDVLNQARGVASAAFDHQDIPFDRLIEELASKEASQTPLIQMMINVLTASRGVSWSYNQALEMPGLRINPEPIDPGPLPIDLILIVDARPETVYLHWHYSTELFNAETVMRLADQLERVLGQLVHTPHSRVGDMVLLDTAAPALPSSAPATPADVGFVELFQRQVGFAPDAPAVVANGVITSFEELNRRANRLAHRLRQLGVAPETTVGLLLDRSPELAVAVLGVLKAGGAYVPLDPAYPSDRIAFMLADARVKVLVSTGEWAEPAEIDESIVTVLLDAAEAPPADPEADADLPDLPSTTSAAYAVYTSGSTGEPKGAVIEHRSLVTFAREVVERLQLGAGDRFLQFASPSFDVLVEELFPIWLAGGAVVIPPPGPGLNLVELAERERLSVMELPAAYWHEWVRELDRTGQVLPSSLRLVIVGAERVLPERLAMWQKLGVPLMHVYGITETTVSSTFFRLSPNAGPEDLQHLPIGTALPSADLQILDEDLRPVPKGGIGELYIGGISLARGYLHRPGLTADRFVAHPDPTRSGERAYRTGDLVRQRADGNLEFLSRVDAQIKIRGFRVEPAEIESAMCRHPQVAQAVVAVHEVGPGDRRLVAYLVPRARTRPNITDLRRFLGRELPAYLVPAAYVQLEVLPLTANGKVDHDRLPPPGDERPDLEEEFVAPRTPLEQRLADIIAAVLGVTAVGAHDNFFELGGDSILAIQVVARAQEEGIGLSPLDLFEYPTVEFLAQAATSESSEPEPAAAVPAAAVPAATASNGTASNGTASPEVERPAPARVGRDQLKALLGRMAEDD